ncbi:hypothetical protein RV11_GL001414 [Enterococcus phoeniculicola]|jgi:hypothetical protein|nr:hypothetical protein RV11_GL001414 [Enterococcus phoeniculicola]
MVWRRRCTMSRGLKVVGIITSLVLCSVLLMVMAITSPYAEFPFGMNRGKFLVDTLSNEYVQQYLFWVAVFFIILLLVLVLGLIFYPKSKQTFYLKENGGKVSLEKKAIEGFVRSKLNETEFVESPKVSVHATKNKLKVMIKGELKRTASILNKTEAVMLEIQNELQQLLGSQEKVKVEIAYSAYEKSSKPTGNYSRVE